MKTWMDSVDSGTQEKPLVYVPNWHGGNNAACFTRVHDVHLKGGKCGPCDQGSPGSDMHALQFIGGYGNLIDGVELEANGGDALNLNAESGTTVQNVVKVYGKYFKDKRDIGKPFVIDRGCRGILVRRCLFDAVTVCGGGHRIRDLVVRGPLQVGVAGYAMAGDVLLMCVHADELFVDPGCGVVKMSKDCVFKQITGREPQWI